MTTPRLLNSLLLSVLVGSLGASLISGCSMSPPKHMMDIQQGEQFILQQPLSIAAGEARVYLQNAQVTGSNFNHYEPHCRLEIKTLSDQATSILPGHFTIRAVRIGEEEVAESKKADTNRMLTSLLVGQAIANDGDKDSRRTPTMDYVHLYLQSTQQPDVLRLTCAGSLSDGDLFDAPRSYRPQRETINQILGAVGMITP